MEWCDRKLVVSPYYYCLVVSEEQYEKELTKLKISKKIWPAFISKGADATTHFFSHESGKQIAIVTIDASRKDVTPTQKVALIVHEAVHIWQAIKLSIGEKEPSNEFEAYSIQAIVQELLLAYDRANSKKKKK
jgi:hypothetical protein